MLRLAFVLFGLLIGAGTPDDPQSKPTPAGAKPQAPELAKLEWFVGPWELVETHFDQRGGVVATVKGNEDVKWILDRKAIQRTYTSGHEPSRFRAMGTFSYDELDKAYAGVWFDNTSAGGPMILKGTWDDATKSLVCTSESKAKDGAVARHKTVERFPDSRTRVVTTYLLRGNEVVKTLEVHCTRTAPCPAGIQRVIDGG